MQIELRPHVGIMTTAVGLVEVTHDQDILIVDGVHVGYVGHHEGAHIQPIVNLPQQTWDKIRQEVEVVRDSQPTLGAAEHPATQERRLQVPEDLIEFQREDELNELKSAQLKKATT